MFLPEHVLTCMQALTSAGHRVYAVGGCVRDSLLGITPHDYDLCTDATTEQMRNIFGDYRLVTSGEKHGTVGVVMDHQVIEITTFRTEGGYTDNRHPGWVQFVSHIQEDLARRDFTVNAMAYHPEEGYVDPFGGQQDLQNRILRAVGDPFTRFTEDALRILRGVRFAVKYGLQVEPETEAAMLECAPLMDNLARERVFEELCKLLPLVTAKDLQQFAPILGAVIPELKPLIGFDQRSPHHAYDLFTHVSYVVAGVPADLTLRWAALLHDVGKIPTFTRDETGRGHFYGHAGAGSEIANSVLLGLKAPTALREQVVQLIDKHMTKLEPDRKKLRRWISRLGWETVEGLLYLQEADMGSKGTGKPGDQEQFVRIRQLLARIREEDACLRVTDLAVNGHDLMALGFQGREIGNMLNLLLEQVLEENANNDKEALLELARQQREML